MSKEKDYMKDKSFNLRKMVKMVDQHKKLRDIYMKIYTESYKDLGYHYNEIIMGLLYILYVMKDDKLLRQYNDLKTRETDPTRIINEEEEDFDNLEETTTSASSGAYATKFAFAKGKGRYEDTVTFPDGKKVKINTDKHDQGVNTFKEEFEKTDSLKHVEKIKKETAKLYNQDYKTKSLDDLFDFSKDSKKEEEIVKRRLTDEENEEIIKNRGRGMEAIEPDIENQEFEERIKKQMKSPNTDLDMYKHREIKKKEREKALNQRYPKVANPVINVKESYNLGNILECFGKKIDK